MKNPGLKTLGGKSRLVKPISSAVLSILKPGQTYVEPFAGGCNTLAQVQNNPRIAADINFYLIALHKAIQNGWTPPTDVPENLYNEVRSYWYDVRDGRIQLPAPNSGKYEDALIGYIGIPMSFSGSWFGGYPRDKRGTHYPTVQHRSVDLLAPYINNVQFNNCSYDELEIPMDALIYCDPPYGSKGYGKIRVSPTEIRNVNKFDETKFWNWCRLKSKQGHQLLISGYDAPSDFSTIWQVTQHNAVSISQRKSVVEKLFVHKSQHSICSTAFYHISGKT